MHYSKQKILRDLSLPFRTHALREFKEISRTQKDLIFFKEHRILYIPKQLQ